jgi:hypothetical protein
MVTGWFVANGDLVFATLGLDDGDEEEIRGGRMKNEWISIHDALPAIQSWVLVILPHSGPYGTDKVVWWCLYREGKFYDVRDDEEMEVTRWRKPPEIEEEE